MDSSNLIKICKLGNMFIINVSQHELIIVHVYKYDVNLARIMFFRKCCCCLSEDVVPIKEGGTSNTLFFFVHVTKITI